MLHFIYIRKYEMISCTRWGWHVFRKNDKITGFRLLGIGLAW